MFSSSLLRYFEQNLSTWHWATPHWRQEETFHWLHWALALASRVFLLFKPLDSFTTVTKPQRSQILWAGNLMRQQLCFFQLRKKEVSFGPTGYSNSHYRLAINTFFSVRKQSHLLIRLDRTSTWKRQFSISKSLRDFNIRQDGFSHLSCIARYNLSLHVDQSEH